ncbi:MAG: hypothetical protein RR435_06675 [Erysipelotrichaceae bacterium]
MNNIKSKHLKIRNIPKEKVKLASIGSKPYLVLSILLIISIMTLTTRFRLFGLILTIFFIYCIVFLKDNSTVEFYNNFVIFYDENSAEDCYLIFYHEIDSWYYKKNLSDLDVVYFILNDGSKLEFKSLSESKMKKHLNLLVGKEKDDIK